MPFEKDQGPPHDGRWRLPLLYCFLCYCYGLTCPCNIAFPLKGGGALSRPSWTHLDGELAVAQKMERAVLSTLVNW